MESGIGIRSGLATEGAVAWGEAPEEHWIRLFSNDQSDFPEGASHDTASSTHDRRHAVAQSLRRNTEKLRPPRRRPGPILSDQPRIPQPGGNPRIPTVPDQRTPLVAGRRQSVRIRGQIPIQHYSGNTLAGGRTAALPRSPFVS